MSYKTALRALPLVIALGLTACGGGGGSDSSTGSNTGSGGNTGGSTTGNLSTVVAPATYAASSPEASIYAGLNAARLAGGFGTLKQETHLDQASAAHASYTLLNYLAAGGYIDAVKIQQADAATGQLVGHTEASGMPGFTGILATDRAKVAGYTGNGYGETISWPQVLNGDTATTARQCVDGLLASPGHRQILLDPRFTEFGIGFKVNSTPWVSTATTDYSNMYQSACVLLAGLPSTAGIAATSWVGTWPLADTTVSSTGDGHGYGYPASVTVDSSQTLAVSSFVITRTDTGATVPTTSTIAQTGVAPNWAFAVPTVPLAAATEYQVSFVGQSSNGTAITKTWKFKTP